MWSKERIWEWYKEKPWIAGFNYLPSNAVNSTAMWQKEVFDAELIRKELSAGAGIGYNTCRVFMQYILWKDNKEELFDCFEQFLKIAAQCGIKVMPILFDDCAFSNKEPYLGKQDEPTPGIHNSCWTPSPGPTYMFSEKEQELLQAYVVDFVGRYRDDDRILLWDLYNEPGNNKSTEEKCIPLLKNAFEWARSCNPSQPLTAGVWKFVEYDYAGADLSDIISFHDYSHMETTCERIAALEKYDRPMICTEWLHRPYNNTFETHMAFYKEKRIGIVQWGLVAGKTQTYLDWREELNPKEGMPEVWQHDIFFGDLKPYRQEEIDLISALIKEANGESGRISEPAGNAENPESAAHKVIQVPVQEMTPEIMDFMEKRGMIIRICPSHHRFDVEEGQGIGQDVYVGSERAGAHKLLAVGINRDSFSAFGVHDENEEVLLLGGEGEKELYFLFGLHSWDVLKEKRESGTLSGDDFICLRAKYNDPEVSFYTVCAGVLHGEATAGEGLPATFYVTEAAGIKLDFFPWGDYYVKPL